MSGYDYVKDHQEISQQVGYHVYYYPNVPNRPKNVSRFNIENVAGMDNGVLISYNLGEAAPGNFTNNNKGEKILVLRQAKVSQNFDFDNFVSPKPNSTLKITNKIINFPNSKTSEAVVTEKKSSKLGTTSLSYITPDNILINITAMKTTPEEVINFAMNLE